MIFAVSVSDTTWSQRYTDVLLSDECLAPRKKFRLST